MYRYPDSPLLSFLALTKYKQNKIIGADTIKATSCSAPAASPLPIRKNKYPNSSGSLIGVLNLTIDSAPTRPNDKANED